MKSMTYAIKTLTAKLKILKLKKKKKNEIHTEGGASVELDYFTRYSINF